MTTRIQFTKMHGIGNDFVILDNITQAIKITPLLIRRIADRHIGIGCDQVLIVDPPQEPLMDFTYRIFNADGIEVFQCGNGARCFGRYVYDRGLTDKTELKLNTQSGHLTVNIADPTDIQVNMGKPIYAPDEIPLQIKSITPLSQEGRYRIKLLGQEKEMTVLSLGNPHAIIFVPSLTEPPVQAAGKALQKHPAFPRGVNLTFMQVLARNHVRCRVYERGVGETLACGSAACAAVVAGILQEELNSEVKVDMEGGSLTVRINADNEVILSGPAISVFRGEFCLNAHDYI